jgi:hypothetical protein
MPNILVKEVIIEGCGQDPPKNTVKVVVDLDKPDLIGKRPDGSNPYCSKSTLPGAGIVELKTRNAGDEFVDDDVLIADVEVGCDTDECRLHVRHSE